MPKIALVQMSMAENLEANVEKSLGLLEEAAANGAHVVAFPEVQFSPFFPQYENRDASSHAIEIDHPAVQRLCRRPASGWA